jgi:hypothetical protein
MQEDKKPGIRISGVCPAINSLPAFLLSCLPDLIPGRRSPVHGVQPGLSQLADIRTTLPFIREIRGASSSSQIQNLRDTPSWRRLVLRKAGNDARFLNLPDLPWFAGRRIDVG